MKRVLFYFAIWATFLTRAQCTRSAPLYAIGDLGIVGDASVAGASLNNAGQIAITLNHQTGTANETLANKILLYSGGQLLELETLGGIGNGISDINDHGVMVGASDSPDGRYHAVVYTSGQLQDWGDSGELGSVASDINESGTVVGDIRNKQTSQAVIFNGPNDVTHLGTLGGTVSSVSAINNLGQIVGISLTGAPFVPGATDTPAQEAFLYENGHLIGIGTLGGHTSNGYGINDLGQIVGDSSLANGEMHAFLWDNINGMRDLGTPGLHSLATHINNQGVIVGEVAVTPGNYRAAIFDEATEYRLLQDLIPADSGWERLNSATDINDLGLIVGTGVFNGENRAFLLTPTPEPSSLVLLFLAGCGVAPFSRIRRRE